MPSQSVPRTAYSSDDPERLDAAQVLAFARDVLEIEADAVRDLRVRLDGNFVSAIQILLECTGKVVVSGIGKSGHIARKIAATFASTGTPSFFVHPAEAIHGDLGMVSREDVFVAMSNSGESEELVQILPILKRQGARLIAITGNPDSSLAVLADVHIDAHVDKEACPLNLAPTASTTAALALGDALAVTLLDLRGFNRDDYARSHPGGTLGRRLLTYVRDVMRTGEAIPTVREATPLLDALLEMSKKGIGMTAILGGGGEIAGIFTDGDLSRLIQKTKDISALSMGEVMHRSPRSILQDRLAVEAAEMMEQHRINQLLVVDAKGRLVGAVHIHDLTNAKVI